MGGGSDLFRNERARLEILENIQNFFAPSARNLLNAKYSKISAAFGGFILSCCALAHHGSASKDASSYRTDMVQNERNNCSQTSRFVRNFGDFAHFRVFYTICSYFLDYPLDPTFRILCDRVSGVGRTCSLLRAPLPCRTNLLWDSSIPIFQTNVDPSGTNK